MDVDRPVLDAASVLLGINVHLVGPTARGESRSTFRILADDAELVLKLVADAPGVTQNQHRLIRLVESLRRRGYPAPEYLAAGAADGVAFTIQRRLPGRSLEPSPGVPPDESLLADVLPAVLDAVELQRDLSDLADAPWPRWLIDTTEQGGDGYCLHETMQQRADTRDLLERALDIAKRNCGGPARPTDIIHFDLNPANILHEAGRLTGIIDWNVPFAGAAQGDRGFDVATLLFYLYDVEAAREQLWNAATAISGPQWTAVYLCHLVLRQVEWTVRHRPGTDEEHRFLDIATLILADCGGAAPGSLRFGS